MKKIGIGIVCFAVLLMTFITPKLLRAADVDVVRLYSQAEVQEYKTSETYPLKEGFVFAGWYEDAEYNTPVKNTIPEKGAWPKFVDEKVLTVKGQLNSDTTKDSESTSLRLVTSVDSSGENKSYYQEVGFIFKPETAAKATELKSTKVYKSLVAYTKNDETRYTAAEVFGTSKAAYFATKVITGIPKDAFGQKLTVTPYWKTMDGTTVKGKVRTIVISENLPITITVDESGLQENTEFLKITVDENVSTQLIVNGEESAPVAITMSQNDSLYEGTFYISSVINRLHIGANTFTIQASRTRSDGTAYIEEKNITYNSTGFMYARNTGTFTTMEDDGENVLSYTRTSDWEGLGSKYISSKGTNKPGTFKADGVNYMTMQVKLTSGSGITLFYDATDAEAAYIGNRIAQTIAVDTLSTFVDDNGKAGKLELNQWVTLRIPLGAVASHSYRNFNLIPAGSNDAAMLIKNVQYKTDAYQSLPAVTLSANAGNDQLKVAVGNKISHVSLIINGDEENAIQLPIASLTDSNSKIYAYEANLKLSDIINTLPLGENTFTLKASDGATADVTYNNTGFLYVQNCDSGSMSGNPCGELTAETMDGEKVLKFVHNTAADYHGIGSKYIATKSNGVGGFKEDGVKYIRMTVKITNEDPKFKWCVMTNNTSDEFVLNMGENTNSNKTLTLDKSLVKDEWITVTYPLYNGKIQGYSGWTLFYFRAAMGKTIYIKDIQYLKDMTASIENAASTDYLNVSLSGDTRTHMIVNGDTENVYDITLTKNEDAYEGKFDISKIVNELPLGENKLTVYTSSGETMDVTYTNTGFLYARKGDSGAGTLTFETVDDEKVLKYVHTNDAWNGLSSKYVIAGSSQGNYEADGVHYIRMKIKIPAVEDVVTSFRWCDLTTVNGRLTSNQFTVNVGEMGDENNTLSLDKALAADQWITVTYDLDFLKKQYKLESGHTGYSQFYFRAGVGQTFYIKDIQYLKELPQTVTGETAVNFNMPSDAVIANQYTTYYFDSANGSDGNDGLSTDKPKQTLAALNSIIQTQTAGSVRILIKAGSTYTGTLSIKGFQATKEAPLIIDVYGKTAAKKYAKFIGTDSGNGACVEIDGSNVSVSGIEATGDNAKRGIFLNPGSAGAMKNVRVAGNYCHHLNIDSTVLPTDGTMPDEATALKICSNDRYQYERGGIIAHAGTSDEVGPSWFEDIWIEDNRVEYVAKTGIWIFSRWVQRPGVDWGANKYVNDDVEYYPHKNVVIANNTVEYAGGDGIVMGAVWNGWLEGNTSYYAQYLARTGKWTAGIWVHSCRNIWFQYNEAAYTRKPEYSGDGQGFDIDIANRDIYFRYNYSHHNEGGGLLLCNTATNCKYYDTEGNLLEEKKVSAYWGDIVVQNNVFADNQTHEFTMVGNLYDLYIENNTVVLDSGMPFLIESHTTNNYLRPSYGWIFKNNIFVSKDNILYAGVLGSGASEWNLFDHNIFQGFTQDWIDIVNNQSFNHITNLLVLDTGITTDEAKKGYSNILNYKPGNSAVLTGAALTNVKNLYDAGGDEVKNVRYYGAFGTIGTE